MPPRLPIRFKCPRALPVLANAQAPSQTITTCLARPFAIHPSFVQTPVPVTRRTTGSLTAHHADVFGNAHPKAHRVLPRSEHHATPLFPTSPAQHKHRLGSRAWLPDRQAAVSPLVRSPVF